jgi:hypothetical protein
VPDLVFEPAANIQSVHVVWGDCMLYSVAVGYL